MCVGALGAQVAHPDRYGGDIVWAQFFRHVRSHLVGTGLLCAVGGSLVVRHRAVVAGVDDEPASVRDEQRRRMVGGAAIMRDNAAVLEERARELIEAPEVPDGLADWLRLYDRFATEFPGMSAHVGGLADDESPMAGTCGPMKDSFARLWDRAQREGRARRDVTASQALALISSLPKDPATGRTAKPYLDVALEGLQVLTGDQ